MKKYHEISNAEVPGKVRQDNDGFKRGVQITHIIKNGLAGSLETVPTVPASLLCTTSRYLSCLRVSWGWQWSSPHDCRDFSLPSPGLGLETTQGFMATMVALGLSQVIYGAIQNSGHTEQRQFDQRRKLPLSP